MNLKLNVYDLQRKGGRGSILLETDVNDAWIRLNQIELNWIYMTWGDKLMIKSRQHLVVHYVNNAQIYGNQFELNWMFVRLSLNWGSIWLVKLISMFMTWRLGDWWCE